MQPYLPLGTLYAATALRDQGISVAVFDTMLEPPEAGFKTMLQRTGAKVVVVYEDDFNFLSKMCLTRMRDVAWQIARIAKDVGAATIVHGSDSTDNPDVFVANGFDYVLSGEAEDVLASICSSILGGLTPPHLTGVVRRGESGGLIGTQRKLARNPAWEQLSFPARDLIDFDSYRSAWTRAHGYFSTNMVASRGCPFRCNWCAKPISGDRFQLRPAASVAEEMELLKSCGAEHIWFGDDVFALNRHWVKDLATQVSDRDAAVPFKIQSRADLMHEDTVLHLKSAGCEEAWIGVESGSQFVLDSMEKGITVEQVVTARTRLKNAGIRAGFFLQFGYPGETWTELQETIELVRRLQPDDIGISFSYPLPGTGFYERVHAQLGPKRNWVDSNDLCIMFQAAYTTDFYRAVRDALHAEVESWRDSCNTRGGRVASLWRAVHAMESGSRRSDATDVRSIRNVDSPSFIPLENLVPLHKV
jgi:radical SAM superfamily enzyme YgiQ (UPF0313 family)